LAQYIDWGPFFQTWDLAGPFPAILDDAVVGAEARKVYADGQAMLKKIVDGRWLTANAVVALYPANNVDGDDIAFYFDETRSQRAMTWCGLRQQTEKHIVDGKQMPSRCLADFVAPGSAIHSGAGYAGSTGAGASFGQNISRKDESQHGLRLGMLVFHAKFGEGTVLTLEGAGDDARAQINFPRHGTKWLALSVAKLTPVP
jgi:5-methyltetrahydrofolate--homocysteine methyltransferase